MKVIQRTGTANTTYAPGRIISYLAIHYTAGVTCKDASGTLSWFANPAAGGSADYVVDETNLYQYNPDPRNRYCHAVGSDRYNTKGGRLYGVAKNSNCVSLEICSGNTTGKITYPNDPHYYFSTAVITKAIEVTQYLMELYGIDADHVIRHYDVNGKECPGVIGWNTDSGSEDAWNNFHEAIGGAPIVWYRVRLSWDKPETQVGAYIEKDNAIACADAHPGFSVYDDQGNAVYTAPDMPVEPTTDAEKWIALIAPDAVAVGQINGILPSVIIAQTCLETGFGKTDLAQRHNIFGMKCDLINGTWDQWSTWDHVHYYEKYSPEEEGGRVVQRKSKFRVYDSFRQCIEDYCAFLLHVKNDKGLKYACIKGWKDPAAVIHRIRIGTGTDAHPDGYATDSGYEKKVLKLIDRYNLRQYDTDSPSPTPPQPTPGKNYRVRVGIFAQMKYLEKMRERIKEKTGLDCFTEAHDDGTHIYCGSFSSKANAEARSQLLRNAGFDTAFEEV